MKLPSTSPKISKKLQQLVALTHRFRFILILAAVALAIGYSAMSSQSYLAPTRDENAYNEKKTSLSNFQSIDYKFAEELKRRVTDVEITVEQLLPNNRDNPFTE